MTEAAKKYLACGLNVIPVNDMKQPLVESWTRLQREKILLNGQFEGAHGIAVIAGAISGGVECIDIDLKNDLSGTLYSDYKNLINQFDHDLLKKLTVEKTPSGGYHFIYRCKKNGRNTKLAKRVATESEAKGKIKALGMIETRGEGGYFVAAPSPGYELIYGSFESISTITSEERKILLDCAIAFNTYAEPEYQNKEHLQNLSIEDSPFKDWDERGDIQEILKEAGWKFVRQQGERFFYLRPGSTNRWSANYHAAKKLFYVFTDSSEFQPDKAYTNTTVLRKIKFNGDYRETAKWLYQHGYGKQESGSKIQINLNDDKFDFVVPDLVADEYITQIRNGTFKQGLSTGIPVLDQYWRFKPGSTNVFLGHDNVGKSILTWYFAVLSAKMYDWKWAIHHSENKTGGVKRKLMEFACCKHIKQLSEQQYQETKKWVEDHFVFLIKDDTLTYKEYLLMAEKLAARGRINSLLIDPYNSLYKPDKEDRHEWDYKVMAAMRMTADKGITIFINCHAVTEALRKKYPKEHELHGYPMPPDKADTEGGGKFANRPDNFITIHRLNQHKEKWMYTEIHVKKIKEMETGGSCTPLDEPVTLQSLPGAIGFEDINGFNPILKTGKPEIPQLLSYTEPISEQINFSDEPAPF